MQKLHPCLWFDDRIEEAANFYATDLQGQGHLASTACPPTRRQPRPRAGSVLTAHVDILGQRFMLLNGGPQFKFNEAVSFVVNTKDQAETDYYWNALDRRWRRGEPVRLAQGQVRRLLADRPRASRRAPRRLRQGRRRPRHAGHVQDAERSSSPTSKPPTPASDQSRAQSATPSPLRGRRCPKGG